MNDQMNQIFGNVDLSINKPQPETIMAGFPVINSPSIESLSDQQQLGANQIRTASIKGTQNVNGTITVIDSGGVNRVLMGYQKDGFGSGHDYGVKVSQNGFDVGTATDAQLVMSSGFNSFKIVQSGNTTLGNFSVGSSGAAFNTSDDLGTTLTTHNLGYVPICLVFLNLSGAYVPLPLTTLGSSGPGFAFWKTWYAYTTSTQLILERQGTTYNDTASFTGDQVKWYLLRETAS